MATTIVTSYQGTPGLLGSVYVEIRDPADASVLIPRTSVGIREDGDGFYVWTGSVADHATYEAIWDENTATEYGEIVTPGTLLAPGSSVIPITPDAESLLCSLWFDPATLECDGVVAPVDAALFVQEACEFLYVASGYQYPGICTSTVRPCTPDYGCYEDGCWSCAAPYNVVKLFEPVVAVQSVMVNGEILDASEYRLYDKRYLQKLVGGWPWQNLILPPGEVGTWSVTFTHGAAPPLAGVLAAQDLACRISAGGVDCTLPPHVVLVGSAGREPGVRRGAERRPQYPERQLVLAGVRVR